VSYYLGLKVSHDLAAGHLRITQKSYIDRITLDIYKTVDLQRARPSTPLAVEPKAASSNHQASKEALREYQSGTGSLMYAMTVTRPDIACHLSVVSRFLTNPDNEHHGAVRRIAQYLHHYSDFRIQSNQSLLNLIFRQKNLHTKLINPNFKTKREENINFQSFHPLPSSSTTYTLSALQFDVDWTYSGTKEKTERSLRSN
jgi:cAMP phosphodiesterase